MPPDDGTVAKYSEAVQKMASEGLRVLGVAKSVINESDLPEIQHDFDFEFIGLIGLQEPSAGRYLLQLLNVKKRE